MNLIKPVQVVPGVFQIRAMGARVTVLFEDDEVMLVDTGLKGGSGIVFAGLQGAGLSKDLILTVVITHHHPDHSSALAELVAGTGITVAAHRLEAGMIDGRQVRPNPLQNKLVARLTQPVMDRLDGGPVAVDVELDDGDVLPFASPVQVVHLPGHTPGSIGLYLPDKKLVIVGDALQYRFARRLSPPAPGVTRDPMQAMRSLRKLLKLDFDTICFSHYPPMRSGAKAALSKLLEDSGYA